MGKMVVSCEEMDGIRIEQTAEIRPICSLSSCCSPIDTLMLHSSAISHLYPTSGLLHLATSPFLGRKEAGQLSYATPRV